MLITHDDMKNMIKISVVCCCCCCWQ